MGNDSALHVTWRALITGCTKWKTETLALRDLPVDACLFRYRGETPTSPRTRRNAVIVRGSR